MTGSPSVRVLIADDHPAARNGLRLRLAREPDLVVIGEAVSFAQAIELAAGLEPDVVLVDLALPDGDGIELVGHIRERVPRSACVVLSLHDTTVNRRRAADAGVAAFVGKQEPSAVLLAAIRDAAARSEQT